MPPRLVEQWITMYEVWPSEAGTSRPASIHPVRVTPERKRNPEHRRWWGQHLRTDGSVYYEGWIEPYNFQRFYFSTELEAWEGLLDLERTSLAHFKEGVAQAEREVGELEQHVRFKRWQADQTPAAG